MAILCGVGMQADAWLYLCFCVPDLSAAVLLCTACANHLSSSHGASSSSGHGTSICHDCTGIASLDAGYGIR